MKKFISVSLKTVGIISLVLTALFGWMSFNAFLERINHGSGLMFADAEIFLGLMLFFLFAGVLCFWIEKRIKSLKS